jgi:hypothetical protein
MSRVLITGMSAPQMSISANKRSLSFAGVIEKALTQAGHQVTMMEPDIEWTAENLDYYDAVLVGVSPITSITANKVYGALHVIGEMYDSDKITLFIDAPNPAQITASLRAIALRPEDLTKPFFSSRKGYQLAKKPEVSEKLLRTVNRLLNDEWPDTLYPALPWTKLGRVVAELPLGVSVGLSGINLDAYLIDRRYSTNEARLDRWAADSLTSTWTQNLTDNLSYPLVPIRVNKGWTDEDCKEQIALSIGTIMPRYKGGTWWNYRYLQSLNTLTPVITEWRESSKIGSSWSVLGSTVEAMSSTERQALSLMQAQEYVSSIPTIEEARNNLEDLLGLRFSIGKESNAV